ncbi:sensor domain-containing protein [Chitinimonas koreensis]|uniref:sensor domain-containing protein n=1 Tax=Chitinimonas koreensis TaxID=356302 RepID=UPI00040DFDF7|nr:EAL domain-containing protein [Chitinimonas koreensis]QNM96519.1 EAL domain-containing protein [Chitinimonas koreensis]
MTVPFDPIQDQAFFRQLVEEAEEGVWVIDADSRTCYLNARMAAMLGGEPAQMLGRPLWDFMDEAEREIAQRNVARRRSGVRETHEFVFRRLDGGILHAELSAAPLLAPDGSYGGCFAFVSDIGWRRAAEQSLSESERAYREVFEHSRAVKLMIDPASGAIVASNAAARAFYGYEATELAGLRIDQINTLTPAEVAEEMARARREERSHFLFRHRLKNGELRDVEVHSNPISVGGRTLLYSIIHDIGRQTEAERLLRLTRHTVERAHLAVVWLTADGTVREANLYAGSILGLPHNALTGRPLWDFEIGLDLAAWQRRWNEVKTSGSGSWRAVMRTAAGGRVPIEVYASHLAFETEEFIVAYGRDIVDQARAEGLLNLQHRVLESMAAGQSLGQVMDRCAREVEALSPAVRCSILLLEGDRLRHGAAPSLPGGFMAAIDGLQIGPAAGSCGTAAYYNRAVEVGSIETDPLWDGYRDLARAAGLRACWASPIRAGDGRVLGTFALYYGEEGRPDAFDLRLVEACTRLIGIAIERLESEQRVHTLAFFDGLTGLPNRALLADRVELALARAQRDDGSLALLFIDLDRFKTVNDSLGHAVGDRMLRTVARRLEDTVRESDTVCRLGGDEFVLLLPDCDMAGAAAVAEKLIGAVAEKMAFDGLTLTASASVGIALYPADAGDYDTLLRHADAAMYRAKEKGRDTYCFYRRDMNEGAARRLEIEAALRDALALGQLLLHYQPQTGIPDGRLYGLEALVRWRHPEWGMVSPAQFIPVAEESGLIDAIGRWVLDQACRQLAQWQAAGLAVPRVAVNLSARQFRHDDVPAMVADTLARNGVAAECLTLEITESLMMMRDEGTLEALQRLVASGVTLAVDDFGTGYSSLSYLRRFPVRELKLDQSFVRALGDDPQDRALASAVVRIGQSLSLTVVAEGVETAEQLAFLREEGCEVAQGYHFARPMPADQLEDWLAGVSPALAEGSGMVAG